MKGKTMGLTTKHFRFMVQVTYKGDGKRFSMWQRYVRTYIATTKAITQFGGMTRSTVLGGWWDQQTGRNKKGKTLVFDIGIRSNFPGSHCHYRRAVLFAEYLRVLFEQDSVYFVMPTGAGFIEKG